MALAGVVDAAPVSGDLAPFYGLATAQTVMSMLRTGVFPVRGGGVVAVQKLTAAGTVTSYSADVTLAARLLVHVAPASRQSRAS